MHGVIRPDAEPSHQRSCLVDNRSHRHDARLARCDGVAPLLQHCVLPLDGTAQVAITTPATPIGIAAASNVPRVRGFQEFRLEQLVERKDDTSSNQ